MMKNGLTEGFQVFGLGAGHTPWPRFTAYVVVLCVHPKRIGVGCVIDGVLKAWGGLEQSQRRIRFLQTLNRYENAYLLPKWESRS